jgi:hypothetical protein
VFSNEEEIHTKSDVGVEVEDRGRKGNRSEGGGAGGGRGSGHLAFEGGDVGSVNGESPKGVVASEGTVKNVVVVEEGSEAFFIRPTQHAVEATGSIRLLDLAGSKLFLVGSHGGKKSISVGREC